MPGHRQPDCWLRGAQGLAPYGDLDGETETKGLADLAGRCTQYAAAGARFAKWRAALRVGERTPSEAAVQRNAAQLAEYAAVCQACGLVPVVEPEVLIDGGHGIARSGAVAERVLQATMAALWRQPVTLEAVLIKPMMVLPGADCAGPAAAPADVARATLQAVRRCGASFLAPGGRGCGGAAGRAGGACADMRCAGMACAVRACAPARPVSSGPHLGRRLSHDAGMPCGTQMCSTSPAGTCALARASRPCGLPACWPRRRVASKGRSPLCSEAAEPSGACGRPTPCIPR